MPLQGVVLSRNKLLGHQLSFPTCIGVSGQGHSRSSQGRFVALTLAQGQQRFQCFTDQLGAWLAAEAGLLREFALELIGEPETDRAHAGPTPIRAVIQIVCSLHHRHRALNCGYGLKQRPCLHAPSPTRRPPDRAPLAAELIGILSVAVITAGTTIVNHLAGQAVEAVQLRPVAGYAGLMVVLCLALAWRHEHDWERSRRCSELLRTEAHAARIDGLISAVAGAALLGAPLLERTPLQPLVPVADSALVLLLALVVLPKPLQQFWRALRQSAGAACDPGLIARTRDAVQELLSGISTWLLDLTVMKVGRTTFVVAYLNPAMPVDGPWIDRLGERIDAR